MIATQGERMIGTRRRMIDAHTRNPRGRRAGGMIIGTSSVIIVIFGSQHHRCASISDQGP
jgi:hypothetical protein